MKPARRLIIMWTLAWVVLGTLVGIFAMLDRTPVFAESGGKSGKISDYAFWVPALAVFGLIGGAISGVLYVLLIKWSERWTSMPLRRRSIVCGTAAGVIVGLFAPPMLLLTLPAGVITGWWVHRFLPAT